eukprot:3667539-Pyramimonas_sp.AAC.1
MGQILSRSIAAPAAPASSIQIEGKGSRLCPGTGWGKAAGPALFCWRPGLSLPWLTPSTRRWTSLSRRS